MKSEKNKSKLRGKTSGRRRVLEVYSGNGTVFEGAIVVEEAPFERILYWAQAVGASGPYDSEAEEEQDRLHMLKIARDLAADDHALRRHKSWVIDYRAYGLPTSTERMPDSPYTWAAYKPGRFAKDIGRELFPYCPFRYQEMLAKRAMLIHAAGGPMLAGELDSTGKITPYHFFEAAYQATKHRRVGRKDGAR